jgi:chromosome segregation ATPase
MSDQHHSESSSTGQFLVLGIVGLIVLFYFYSVLSKTGNKDHTDEKQQHAQVVKSQAPAPKPKVKSSTELLELQKKITALELLLREKNGQLKSANADLSSKQSNLDKVQSQLNKIKNDFSKSQSSLSQTQSKLDLALLKMRKLESNLNVTKEQRDHTILEAEELRSSLVDVKSELNKSSEIIGRVQQILRSEESISQQ